MRYAIYYAPPPGTLLHRLGSEWLGRDAFGGAVEHPVPGLHGIITDAARYGLHATLKAPFALRERKTRSELGIAAAQIARQLGEITISSLVLRRIDGFLALVPDSTIEALSILESACVQQLDGFRQLPSPQEIARRRGAGLSARQERNLDEWGYPYVLDEFRFHITLTRRMSEAEAGIVEPMAHGHFAAIIGKPHTIGSVAIFHEPGPGQDFAAEECFSLQSTKGAR